MAERSQPVNLSSLNLNALINFIDELREDGYNISVDQYIAVQDLLLALAAQKIILDDPLQFSQLISPILCSTRLEQQQFQQKFRRWAGRLGLPLNKDTQDEDHASRLEQVSETVNQQFQGLRWWIISAVVLAVINFFPFAITNVATALPLNTLLNWPLTLKISISLLIIVFLIWYGCWYYRAHLFLIRRKTTREPDITQISIKGLNKELFETLPMFHIAQKFRRRTELPSNEVNVDKTVDETVRNLGWLTPAYSSRQVRPEYLVLVNRISYQDHFAQLVDEVVAQLGKNEVYITTYYFDRDPRICFVQHKPGLSLSIDQIITKHKEHRLTIFTEGEKFFSPLTGKIEPWVDIFSVWTHRAILTPEPTENWGYWEQALAQYFTVLPATTEGLELFIQAVQQSDFIYEPPSGVKIPIPAQLKVRPLRWVQRDAPEPALVDEVLESLHHYLGNAGYYWLSACAVYPALHWNLTLYLGNTLYDQNQQKLFDLHRLIDLSRLPWFRYGYMPDWLRIRLISGLSRKYETNIRLMLQKLLLNTVQGSADDFQLDIVTEHNIFISLLARFVHRFTSKVPHDSPLRDPVFVNFIAGWWHTQLAVRLPLTLYNLFVQISRSSSDPRTSTEPLITTNLAPSIRGAMYTENGDIHVHASQSPLARAKLFTNVWYLEKEYRWWQWRNPDIGTLELHPRGVRFLGRTYEVRMTRLQAVTHSHQPGELKNNWVKVNYLDEKGTSAVAFFADATKLGFGSLIGGSEAIFQALRSWQETVFPTPEVKSKPLREPDDQRSGSIYFTKLMHTVSGNISILWRQWVNNTLRLVDIPPHLTTSWVGRSIYIMNQLGRAVTARHWWTLISLLTLWVASVWLITPILRWPLEEVTARGQACLLYAIGTLVIPFFVTLTTPVDRFDEIKLETRRAQLRFWFLKLIGAYTGFALAAGAIGVALIAYYLGWTLPRAAQWLLALLALFFSHLGARRIPGDRLKMYDEMRLHDVDRLVVIVFIMLGPGVAAFVYVGYSVVANPGMGLLVMIALSSFALWERRKRQPFILMDWELIAIYGLLLPLILVLSLFLFSLPFTTLSLWIFSPIIGFTLLLIVYGLVRSGGSLEEYSSLNSQTISVIVWVLLLLSFTVISTLIDLPPINDWETLVSIIPYILGMTLLIATSFVRNPPLLTILGVLRLLVVLLGIRYGLNVNLWLGQGLIIIAVILWIVWGRRAWSAYLWVHPSFEWMLVTLGGVIYLRVQMTAPLWLLFSVWLVIIGFLTAWAYRVR